MSTDLVPIVKQEGIVPLSHFHTPTDIHELQIIAAFMVKSGFFKDTQSVAQAVMKIIAGAELGIGPVQSQKVVYFVKGSPGYAANFVAAQIKRNPNYNYKILLLNEKGCVLEFYERDLMGSGKFELVGEVSFVEKDAKRANLIKEGGAWTMYPRSMYFSRALTAGARLYCPDAFGAAPVYTREELGDEDIIEGELLADEVIVEQVPEDLKEPETPPEPAPATGDEATSTPEDTAKALEEATGEPAVVEELTEHLKPWTDKDLSVEDARNVLYAIAIEEWGYENIASVRKTLVDAKKWTGTPPIPDLATLDEVADYLLAKSPDPIGDQ